jgi:hypothetical protein
LSHFCGGGLKRPHYPCGCDEIGAIDVIYAVFLFVLHFITLYAIISFPNTTLYRELKLCIIARYGLRPKEGIRRDIRYKLRTIFGAYLFPIDQRERRFLRYRKYAITYTRKPYTVIYFLDTISPYYLHFAHNYPGFPHQNGVNAYIDRYSHFEASKSRSI